MARIDKSEKNELLLQRRLKLSKSIIIFFFCFLSFSSEAFIPGSDRLELGFGAEFPVQTGLQIRINANTNFYIKGGVGFAIEPFMISYRQLGKNLGIPVNELYFVSTALINSVVFSGRIGLTMSVYEGPYFELGYNLITLGRGEVTGGQAAFGLLSTDNSLSATSVYQVDITNHGPTFHLGYRFILIDKLSMNIELGGYKPIASHLRLGNGTQSINTKRIKDFVISKMWLISLGVWINFSF